MNIFTKSGGSEKNIDAYTVKGPAEKTYSKNGSPILAGSDTLRVHFNVFNPSNTKFDVECYKQKPSNIETIQICINKGKKIYLDLKDCERLHISEKTLLEANERKNFHLLWEKKIKKFRVLTKTITLYDKIINNYDESPIPGFLLSREMQELPFPKIDIVAKTEEEKLAKQIKEEKLEKKREDEKLPLVPKKGLMKIISILFEHIHSKPLPAYLSINLPCKVIDKYDLQKMCKILVYASYFDDCVIINQSYKYPVAIGYFSKVFKVHNIATGKLAALKESRVIRGDVAIEDIEDEIDNLSILEAKGITGAIQKPVYFSFKAKLPKKITYVGPYYNGIDLFEIHSLINHKERIKYFQSGFTDLVYALYILHEHNFFLNDIKPENIFVNVDNDGKLTFYFGDLGGLRRAKNHEEKFEIKSHTPSYSPFPPRDTYNLKELQEFDIFQFGSTLITALTGIPPYLNNPNCKNYPNLKIAFNTAVLSSYCSKEAIELLKYMCCKEADSRFTAKQAFDWVNNPTFQWEKPT
jgi:hypothetical protein